MRSWWRTRVPSSKRMDFMFPLMFLTISSLFSEGEYTEISACHAHVGADAYGTDGNQYAGHGLGLQQEDITQFLLQETGYFILSGSFHTVHFFMLGCSLFSR